MPGFNSYVRLVATSQKLLDAVAANPDQLKSVDPLKGQFDEAVTQLKELVTRRDTLQADKQMLSRQLLDAAHRVNDLAIDFRALIKATLGSRSEKLTEFDVRPRRKVLVADRPRSRKAPAPEPPPVPPAQTGKPTSGQP